MAIDLWSGNSSPRISFSHDLHNNDDHDQDHDTGIIRIESSSKELNYPDLGLDYNDQFNFCTIDSAKNESITADKLFSNGVILPLQLQERFVTSQPTLNSLPPLPSLPHSSSTRKIAKAGNVEFEQKNQTKSIWGGIKRSSSVHCENSCKKSSFWSLPLLKRSNSTGSAKDQRPQKRNLQKEQGSSLGTNGFYVYSLSQKPPLKKNCGNVGKITPLINVGSGNLFGLGSFFGNGKDKKNKK